MKRDHRKKLTVWTCCLLLAILWGVPRVSEGACGAATSSCKNCHEVKGEMPVNAKGDYHTQHAFGDFCVFCHSGNTAGTTKEAAHAGMVNPLGDIEESCATCHPDDFEKRAEGYGSVTKTEAAAASGTAAPTGEAPYISPPTPDPSAVKPEDLVDYNRSGESAPVEAAPAEEQAALPEKEPAPAAEPPAPAAETEKPGTGGSGTPVVAGIALLVGLAILFMVFRKK
jgi:hypothetical protein